MVIVTNILNFLSCFMHQNQYQYLNELVITSWTRAKLTVPPDIYITNADIISGVI